MPFTRDAGRFDYEPPLDFLAAEAIADHFARTYSPTHGRTVVYRIADDLGLVAGVTRLSEGAGAYRFVLYHRDSVGTAVVDTSRHMGDSEWLRPHFFERDGTTLVLADVGSEYSWGLLAFEITDGRLRELPPPRVGQPLYDDIGPAADALGMVKAFFVDGSYELEFGSDLVLNPGTRDQFLLCRTAGSIMMRLVANGWEIKGTSRRHAPPDRELPRCR